MILQLQKNNNPFIINQKIVDSFAYLNCPVDRIIPVQISIQKPATITPIEFYLKNGTIEEEITTINYTLEESSTHYYIQFEGITLGTVPCGVFQYMINVGADTYYSNFINFFQPEMKTFELKYWNGVDTYTELFSNGFMYSFFGTIPVKIDKPFYKEIVIEKTNGQKYKELQVVADTYILKLFGEKETVRQLARVVLYENFQLLYENMTFNAFERPEISISEEETGVFSIEITCYVNSIEKTNYKPVIQLIQNVLIDDTGDTFVDNTGEAFGY